MDDIITTNLLDALGLSSAPEEEKQDFLKKAAAMVLGELVQRIKKQLPEDKQEDFLAVFSGEHSDDERLLFLRNYVPNFEELLIDEALAFKKEALAAAKSQ